MTDYDPNTAYAPAPTPTPTQFTNESFRTGPDWENNPNIGSLISTVLSILKAPTAFFATMRLTGGLGTPLVFALLCAIPACIMGEFYSVVIITQLATLFDDPQLQKAMAEATAQRAGFMHIVNVLVNIVAVVPGLFICAGIMHLFLMMFGAAKNGFEATFRVVAYYFGAIYMLLLIPVCGLLANMVYGILLPIIGYKEAHETDTWRVVCAFFLPTLLILCCVSVAIMLVIGGAAAIAAQQGGL